MSKDYFVYIATNKENRSLYTGVTNDFLRRMQEHRTKAVEGYTSQYNINKLVFFEMTESVESAIFREKQIKGWTRKKKIDLININNKNWDDLSETLFL